MDWQTLAVVLIVAVAACYSTWRLMPASWRVRLGGKAGGCASQGGSGGCSQCGGKQGSCH